MGWFKWVPVLGQIVLIIERIQENRKRKLELEILRERNKKK